MIIETEAKSILGRQKRPDEWFGVKYTMNIYRGCEHGCIYCDSRSERYGLDRFHDVQVKVNALELLKRELRSKRDRGTVGTGAMSDPYTHAEADLKLTRACLELLEAAGFPVHIITKSEMIVRDDDVLQAIAGRTRASVAFSFSTADDSLSAKLEPGASRPAARLKAMKALAQRGIYTGALVMPVLPYITDSAAQIRELLLRIADSGGRFAIPWFGMSLRDRQREYYYGKLDRLFPGMRRRYESRYGDRYDCAVPESGKLEAAFREICSRHGLISSMHDLVQALPYRQLELF